MGMLAPHPLTPFPDTWGGGMADSNRVSWGRFAKRPYGCGMVAWDPSAKSQGRGGRCHAVRPNGYCKGLPKNLINPDKESLRRRVGRFCRHASSRMTQTTAATYPADFENRLRRARAIRSRGPQTVRGALPGPSQVPRIADNPRLRQGDPCQPEGRATLFPTSSANTSGADTLPVSHAHS